MPWEIRVPTVVGKEGPKHLAVTGVVYVAVSSSARNGVVRYGGAIKMPRSACGRGEDTVISLCLTLSTRNEQNPYSAELAAVADALNMLP